MLACFHVRASVSVGALVLSVAEVASPSGEGEIVRQSYNSWRGCALSEAMPQALRLRSVQVSDHTSAKLSDRRRHRHDCNNLALSRQRNAPFSYRSLLPRRGTGDAPASL
ncbi:hypothetical protein [Nostoc sp.]|uniref:hypothetical protein n=1 Tax=Nostoc sp. TaxID=1180 RepID=UPI002FFC4848